MTSEQVLLEDNFLDLEAKELPWESLAAEIRAEVSGNTIHNTMKAVLDYDKRLACMEEHQSDRSKELGWSEQLER